MISLRALKGKRGGRLIYKLNWRLEIRDFVLRTVVLFGGSILFGIAYTHPMHCNITFKIQHDIGMYNCIDF